MNPLISILIANVAILGAIALFFYKSWLDYLRPDWFTVFRIYENGFLNYNEHKFFHPINKKKDQYTVDKCEYSKEGVKPYIDPKGVYTWNFVKGSNKPIQFTDQGNIDGNLIFNANINLSKAIDDAVSPQSSMEDFLKTWGFVIVAVAILALLGYMVTRDQQQTALILNMTRR